MRIKRFDNYIKEDVKYFIEYFGSVGKLKNLSKWLRDNPTYEITGLKFRRS